jgi:dynein heavy chain, axonemal|tara:strand:- start:575 stop:994 length:420 start_codon:yes stop_codon:yes gene_type:complete
MSVNNALVVEKTKRFCLLVDPQVQGITWLKNQFDDGGTLTVVKQNDSQFKKLIEIAIDMGRTVVVENVGEEIGMNLQSLMKKQVSKYGGQRMVLFCRKSYKYDKNFRLFVVSAHPRPHFDVNITNHVTLLNFSVNIESL